MPRVVHFEIYTDNVRRATNFYKKVFGWKINKWNGPIQYWLIRTGRGIGINGGLIKRPVKKKRKSSVDSYVCTIDVANIDKYIKKIEENKGMIEIPKQAVPGVGWMSYFRDTEGNLVGMMQADKKAK